MFEFQIKLIKDFPDASYIMLKVNKLEYPKNKRFVKAMII